MNLLLYRLVASVVAFTALEGALCRQAIAQPRPGSLAANSVLRGDFPTLTERAANAARLPCADLACRNQFSPITLTLRSPKTGRIALVVNAVDGDSVGMPENVDSPLLLSGTIRTSSAGRSRVSHRFAAVLYRDTQPPILEIALPAAAASRRSLSRPILVKAPLEPPERMNLSLKGRADVTSSFHRRFSLCPLHVPQPTIPAEKSQAGNASSTLYDVLYLATDFEPSFARVSGCGSARRCNNKIRGTIHRTSMLYEEPFGLVLKVAQQFGPTSFGRSTEPSVILGRFVDFNNANRPGVIHDGRSNVRRQADLLQLFTGKTLDDEVYGLTYLSVACRNDMSNVASLVVQHVSDSLNPTIVAHHIGHTLSAVHSAEGIMRAILSEPAATTFDQESRDTIAGYLSMHYNSCRGGKDAGSLPITPAPTPTVTPTPTATPTATPTQDPFPGVPRSLELSVRRTSTSRLEVRVQVSALYPGCSVTVRASGSERLVDSGRIIRQFVPAELVTRASRRFQLGIGSSFENSPVVHFWAEHTCADGQRIEVSEVARFNPNTGDTQRKLVSKPRWIKLLADAFS